ncbi:MAG: methyltransferase domain-containing protein [Methanomicrobiales archaeon]|nr:methyltransferase domain-containing protein [Methanomicrobiales archaeon]
MRVLFELSGEHPALPCAEIESVGRVIECGPQVAIAECPAVSETVRLALTHTVMEYLGQCPATEINILTLLSSLGLTSTEPFRVRVKKVQGSSPGLSQLTLERLIGMHISGQVSLEHPGEEFRLIITGTQAYLGRVLTRIDRGAYLYRDPLRRPFFHPGVMLPRLARAMVNLSLVQKGELLIDPFCGTGGMLLEAQLIGAEICGGDADPLMVSGARRNIPYADVVIGDATSMPFCDCRAEAVVTDLPYGQSVGIRAACLDSLYHGALQEIHRILRPGRRAVLISHRDIRNLIAPFTLLQYHEQRVHKSLIRRIMVMVKE